MVGKPGGRGFAFVEAGDAARRLGLDRLTLERWVKEGRLKTHHGMGRDIFFRARDIDELYNELHPDDTLAEAIAADEQEVVDAGPGAMPGKKAHDPQMRVYLRLQADAKWYDISADDIQQWARQLPAEKHERSKTSIQHAIEKLSYLVKLIEDRQQQSEA